MIGTTSDLWHDDLNVDGAVTSADVDTLVHVIFQSEYGDANLDGLIDTVDFNMLAANFSNSGAGIGWASADFTGDHAVDTLDFNLMAANFGFQFSLADQMSRPELGSTVPEPAAVAKSARSIRSAPRPRTSIACDLLNPMPCPLPSHLFGADADPKFVGGGRIYRVSCR